MIEPPSAISGIRSHRHSLGANLLYSGIQFGLAAAGDEHIGPLLGKLLGGRQSNARAAAGGDRDFSFQLLAHDSLHWLGQQRCPTWRNMIHLFNGSYGLDRIILYAKWMNDRHPCFVSRVRP